MKNTNNIETFLVSTSYQKVLKFLCENNSQEYYDAQIAREIKDISKASANNALRDLHAAGLIQRRYMGNIALNSVSLDTPVLKQFKILLNITHISPLLNLIKHECKEIIMFGESAIGENGIDSQIDLFVVSNSEKVVYKIIEKDTIFPKLHLIIHSPRQVEMFKKEAPLFYENIKNGIRLI